MVMMEEVVGVGLGIRAEMQNYLIFFFGKKIENTILSVFLPQVREKSGNIFEFKGKERNFTVGEQSVIT